MKRIGIMLHYDASVTDKGALSWLLDSECKLGYNFLVWDDGQIFEIIPRDRRASHAGVTKSSNPSVFKYADNLANSAFFGVAISAGGRSKDRATPEQIASVAWVANELFKEQKWGFDETWRFTTHMAEAWPRGRKEDCPGPDKARPVMTVGEVIAAREKF